MCVSGELKLRPIRNSWLYKVSVKYREGQWGFTYSASFPGVRQKADQGTLIGVTISGRHTRLASSTPKMVASASVQH